MKNFKITHKHLMIVIIALAVFLVALGVLNAVFHYSFPPDVMRIASDVVIVIALGVFLLSRKIAKEAQAEKQKKLEEEEAANAAKQAEEADSEIPKKD
jgi:ABC-type nickel/cobalt efflux system permease component RcnA